MGWYVLTLSENPFLVGLTWTARMSLNIFALFAEAIADLLPRNRILATVEFIIAALGLITILLIMSGRLQVWHIFGIAMAAGVVRVFQMPSAQSLVADTLPQDRIGNGAAFNSPRPSNSTSRRSMSSAKASLYMPTVFSINANS